MHRSSLRQTKLCVGIAVGAQAQARGPVRISRAATIVVADNTRSTCPEPETIPAVGPGAIKVTFGPCGSVSPSTLASRVRRRRCPWPELCAPVRLVTPAHHCWAAFSSASAGASGNPGREPGSGAMTRLAPRQRTLSQAWRVIASDPVLQSRRHRARHSRRHHEKSVADRASQANVFLVLLSRTRRRDRRTARSAPGRTEATAVAIAPRRSRPVSLVIALVEAIAGTPIRVSRTIHISSRVGSARGSTEPAM